MLVRFFLAALLLPPCEKLALRASHVLSRRAAMGSLVALPLVPAASTAATASAKPSFELESRGAYKAFTVGDYARAAELWEQLIDRFPAQPLAHANLGTCLIILASDAMQLGQLPPPAAAKQLERALVAFDVAADLGSGDALLLNSRGNALGLLQRWEEAHATYEAAAAAGPREFESIPRCALHCAANATGTWTGVGFSPISVRKDLLRKWSQERQNAASHSPT